MKFTLYLLNPSTGLQEEINTDIGLQKQWAETGGNDGKVVEIFALCPFRQRYK